MSKIRYSLGAAIYALGGVLYGLFVVNTDYRILATIILGLVFGAFFLLFAFFIEKTEKKGGRFAGREKNVLVTTVASVAGGLMFYALSAGNEHRLRSTLILGVFMFIFSLVIMMPLIEKEREKKENKNKI